MYFTKHKSSICEMASGIMKEKYYQGVQSSKKWSEFLEKERGKERAGKQGQC